MMAASQEYLAELADEFLGLMLNVGWSGLSQSARGQASWGESTWIDPRDGQPGVDVSTSFRMLESEAIEIEVIAYDGDDESNTVQRSAVISR
jgi:hypothetical protein